MRCEPYQKQEMSIVVSSYIPRPHHPLQRVKQEEQCQDENQDQAQQPQLKLLEHVH